MARGWYNHPPPTASFKDINNAKCAILCMIDTLPDTIEDKQERMDALDDLIEEGDLRYGSQVSARPRYPRYKLQEYMTQLAQQLGDGIEPTTPKNDIIWQKGSKAIKPAYLKKIGFKQYLKAKEAADDNDIEEEEDQDDAQVSETDGGRASVQEEQVLAKTAKKVPAKTVRPLKCSNVVDNDACQLDDPKALYKSAKGFYCESCIEFVEEEGTMKNIGGCNNPRKNPKCKRSQFKSANLYDDQVLCNPCHELAQQEESSVPNPEDHFDLLPEKTIDKVSEAQETTTQPRQAGTSPVAKRTLPSQATTNIINVENVISVQGHEKEVARVAPFVQKRDDEGKSPTAATSVDGMEERTEQDGTTTSKRAAVSIDHEDEPQHKRQRLEDTLHRTGDTGVSDSYVAGQMNDVFKLLEQAALRFHLDADIKLDTRACVVGVREIKEKLS